MLKKMLHTPLALLAIIAFCTALSACAAPLVGAVSDERSFGEHVSDSQLEASVKAAIVSQQASEILSINVYSFYGDIYLIGEADQTAGAKAAEAAKGVKGVRSVTSYFFPPDTMTAQDLVTEARINNNLLLAEGVPSGKVQVDVWAGQAVLLGILSSQEQMDKVIEVTKGVPGVKSIQSYLILKQASDPQ